MELKTDVLVIGRGLAGSVAAVQAVKQGAQVMIAASGKGASPNVNGFTSWQDGSEDGLEALLCDMLQAGRGMNDEPLVRAALRESLGIYDLLEECGVPLLRDENGARIPKYGMSSGKKVLRGYRTKGEVGSLASNAFPQSFLQRGIRLLEDAQMLFPVMENGRVCGAIGQRSGEWVIIHAKAVILACGGIGTLIPSSTYPGDVSAGYVPFALLAGAGLKDMEFLTYEPAVVRGIEGLGALSLPTSLWKAGALLLNGKGERFLQKYYGTSEELLSRGGRLDKEFVARCIAEEVALGRGTPHGGVWYDARGVDPEKIAQYSLKVRRLAAAGIDLAKQPVEVYPGPHSHMGGVCVDAACRSDAAGLFACGESAGGFLGAGRMPGFGGASAVLLGSLAGKSAAAYIKMLSDDGSTEDRIYQAFLHAQKMCRLFADPNGTFREEVGRILQDSFSAIKSEEGLASGDARLKALMAAHEGSDSPDDVLCAAKAFGAYMTARMMLTAAGMRKESRGCFMVREYDRQDPAWEKHIVFHLEEDGLKSAFQPPERSNHD